MKDFKFWTMCVALMLIAVSAFAGLADLDLEKERRVSLIGSDTGEARTLGGSVIFPIQHINGGFGLQALHVSHNGESISDTVSYRFQAGPKYADMSLQVYVDGTLDSHMDRGLFWRPGVYNFDGWRISGGVGTNWRGTHGDIAESEADEGLLLSPFAFLSFDKENWSVLGRWLPGHDILLEPQFQVEFDRLNLTISGKFGYLMGDPIRQYVAQVDYPF